MGLLQKAVETYDANLGLVGVYREGHEPLAPIGHMTIGASQRRAIFEVSLNKAGKCLDIQKIVQSKILIPVTEESAGRSNNKEPISHPLCDQLCYIAPENQKKHGAYIKTLGDWVKSNYTHPFLEAILSYVKSGTILSDLTEHGYIGKDDDIVCWRIIGTEEKEPACWKNTKLFNDFRDYYEARLSSKDVKLCMISGDNVPIADQHPKGIVPSFGNAKLISSNEPCGFTFHGRFHEAWQASTVGYVASQKAHNALRWLISEQSVQQKSNRVFLCWTPSGKQIPNPRRSCKDLNANAKSRHIPSDYKKALQSTLMSYRKDNQLKGTEIAILAAFDAAIPGRLALTYYNEISLDQFLERMEAWDLKCCWYNGQFGIQAPNLLKIVECAFGIWRKDRRETDKWEVDNKVLGQLLQRLLDCKVSGGIFPSDFVKALTQRASTPQAYEEDVWRDIVHTACSALQKYRYDTNQGGDEMTWELDKRDRSFQFGRLLAVMERAEESYYRKTREAEDNDKTRQTNAIKSMSEYRRRPLTVFERVNRKLHQAYLNRVEPWQVNQYKRDVGKIFAILSEFEKAELNKPLDEVYLMGYVLQRNAFFKNEETTNNEAEDRS